MRMKDVSNVTIGCDLKILRTAFNAARRQGLIHANPVEAVEIPTGESKKREAFTIEEVQNILAATKSPEWKTAILLGFYAGLRLGDAVSLDWSNIDLSKSLLRYRATKTKRMEEVPLHPVLEKHLKSLNRTAKTKLCSKLHGEKIPGRSGLSRQFLEIVDAAGIDKMSQVKARLKGRRFTGKTFHSLRHGFISALANAGVAPELRQKLSGHSDADVHQQYTHLELETLRTAINSIKPPKDKK
jgi:integrase